MQTTTVQPTVPRYLWALLTVYFAANLAHFIHNAEYIAYYPNMPDWLTRDLVYVAWLAVTIVGVLGLAACRAGYPAIGMALVGVYGAFGLDGLAHYSLALCSEHTLLANVTIWSEALAGLMLLLTSAVLFVRFSARRASAGDA
jgi:hypothetical protein